MDKADQDKGRKADKGNEARNDKRENRDRNREDPRNYYYRGGHLTHYQPIIQPQGYWHPSYYYDRVFDEDFGGSRQSPQRRNVPRGPPHVSYDAEGNRYDSSKSTSSISDEERPENRRRERLGSESSESMINPRAFDTKLPKMVRHHDFHLPPGSHCYHPNQPHTHLMTPPPMPGYHMGMVGMPPHPYAVAPYHYPYVFSMPYPAMTMFGGHPGYYDRVPPVHYPGHFFSPHHSDMAHPDRRNKKQKKDKKKKEKQTAIVEEKDKEETPGEKQKSKDQKSGTQ